MLVLPILAASHVQAQNPRVPSPRSQALLDQGKADWFAMRTQSAEHALIAATKIPAIAAEAHYWLGRIYDFKGNRAEAEARFKSAGTPKSEWILEANGFENSVKAADAAIARLRANRQASATAIRNAIEYRIMLRPDPTAHATAANLLLAHNMDLPLVLRLAAEGTIAGERFIRENGSSDKPHGRVPALDRNAAVFAEIAGMAMYLQGDLPAAGKLLAEAARLYRQAGDGNAVDRVTWYIDTLKSSRN
jgi:hypothetical protein